MFKFQIVAETKGRPRPTVIALTHFSDLAEFIRDHAAEAIDPEGKMGLKISIVSRPEADMFVYRPRGKEGE